MKEKTKRGRGRPQSKRLKESVRLLVGEIEASIQKNNFTQAWKINDIVKIIFDGDDYITDKKKSIAYRTINTVKEILRDKYSVLFYSVPGKGYKLVIDPADLKELSHKYLMVVNALVKNILVPSAQNENLASYILDNLALIKQEATRMIGEIKHLPGTRGLLKSNYENRS